MKTWNQHFESKEEEINESHKKGKEEQTKFICETIDKMTKDEVNQVYGYIESQVWKKIEE